jgi:hypothetical protein
MDRGRLALGVAVGVVAVVAGSSLRPNLAHTEQTSK